jgi:hypothetical protein
MRAFIISLLLLVGLASSAEARHCRGKHRHHRERHRYCQLEHALVNLAAHMA